MRSTALLLALALILTGCGDPQKVAQTTNASGSRQFNVDAEKPKMVISLFGVVMGTPDSEAVMAVLEQAQAQGAITNSYSLGQLFEGGVYTCIEVDNLQNRIQLIQQLTAVPTSLTESYYSLVSVESCESP